ncbi:hypothetical protein B0H10DRAFT_1993250 [Mycena sp. CBHHK59/15]|nr:hypothetical protein B0H10DRAFT_1993250 [Mycena sp. CBHHK59/15]
MYLLNCNRRHSESESASNKWVLNTTSAPLFFLLVQLVIAVVLFGITDVLRLFPDRLTFELKTCKGLGAMVGLNVVGLSFSNYTLKYVDVSFYQVARGLVLPFTVATSFALLHARPSLRILLACGAVTAGFVAGVLLDGTPLSPAGVAFGAASSAVTALAAVVIKQALPVVGGSTVLLAWYTNLLSALALAPLVVLAGEGPAVRALVVGATPLGTFVWGSLIAGGLGFLMSIAGPLSIKVTSPISHMVSSAVRGVASSLLGMWLFHDVLSGGRIASIGIILVGSMYYTFVKYQEGQAAAAAAEGAGVYEPLAMDELEAGKHTEERA